MKKRYEIPDVEAIRVTFEQCVLSTTGDLDPLGPEDIKEHKPGIEPGPRNPR